MAFKAERPTETLIGAIREKRFSADLLLPLSVAAIAVFIPIYHLYVGWFSVPPIAKEWVSLNLVMILALLTRPLGRKSWRDKINKWFALDLIAIILLIIFTIRFFIDYEQIILFRYGNADTLDIISGSVTLFILLELGRRWMGWAISLIAGFFLIQGVVSNYLPGPFYGPTIPWKTTIEFIYLQQWGLWSDPMKVAAGYIILFFVLASLWEVSGAMEVIKGMAFSLVGRFTGGPAKVAVIASALIGTIQGTSASNVVTCGSWTIPLMKKMGFTPEFAGAVEAVSSSGGLIVPPVMSLVGFLIAEFLRISYTQVMIAAIIPAILFYVGSFASVHFESKKMGLTGLASSELPKFWPYFKRSWMFILPLAVLVWMIVYGFSIPLSALAGIITAVLCSFASKETRLTFKGVLFAFDDVGRGAIIVILACALGGVISGAFWATGLGLRMGNLIVQWSGGSLLIGLIAGESFAIILGMGMPVIAVYVVLMGFAVPAFISLGAIPLAAHFFLFCTAILAAITPPVAITAYIAAGMAEANVMRTALTACRIGMPLFILPYFYVFQPAFLAEGPFLLILKCLVAGVIGVTAIAAALSGWFITKAQIVERILLFASGVAILSPGWIFELAGVAVLVLVIVYQRLHIAAKVVSTAA